MINRGLLTFLACFLVVLAPGQNNISVKDLRCDNRTTPFGITGKAPRLGWKIATSARDVIQSGYRILVSDDPWLLLKDQGNCWDSGMQESDRSLMVPYGGKQLLPDRKYFWKVQVRLASGALSGWSETTWFRTGLAEQSGWGEAKWISYENLADSMRIFPGVHGSGNNLGNKGQARGILPLFRKEFVSGKQISNATLYVSGVGQYEAFVNGQRIGNSFLSPGWTDYNRTVLYNSFDVTSQLHQGSNVLGVMVGNGFSLVNRERYRKLVIAYGFPKMIARLKIQYTDGSNSEVCSGPDWRCTPSPITYSSIYGGEEWDATREQAGWNSPGFNDSTWKQVQLAPPPGGTLVPETDYPVTVNQSIGVKKVIKKGAQKFLYDFGQNGSGIVELKVKGKRGSVIKLTPGELITPDQEVNQKASGQPYYFTYILKGEGTETWRPCYSYYGFRYVMLEGGVPDQESNPDNVPVVTGLQMLHTCNSSPRVGNFSTSHELFSRINNLIDWAVRSNLQSVVTDCPHREKLGWLEQTYLMGASLHYNYDLYALYRKAIHDMMDAQAPDGLVPDIAPEYTQFVGGFRDSPEWGSAAVILPWMLWEWYGDLAIVEEALPMMKRYVDYLGTRAKGNLLSHGLGDWFDYGPKSPGEAQLTPKTLTATAIYYYDLQLLARMTKLCGRSAESNDIEKLASQVKGSFNREFYHRDSKTYSTGSQTAMAMPLCTGLVDEADRADVLRNLVQSVNKSGNALTAGDIGFHFLVKALEEGGASGLLYTMNSRDDVPGYGFQLKKGATALTESWPALEVVSNNHLMLGHLMEWFYTGLGGISQSASSVAFRDIVIKPSPVGDIGWTKSSFQSPYGLIRSEWKRINGSLVMEVEIPANCTATVVFPVKPATLVTEGGKPVREAGDYPGSASCRIGSGRYLFSMKYP